MKLLHEHNTNIVFQDYGANLLLIVEGTNKNDVEESLNSFVNHGAVEPDSAIDRIKAGEKYVAFFWTTEEKLQRYFRSRLSFSDAEYPNHATEQGANDLAVFLTNNREARRMNFGGLGHVYSIGSMSAEKPDDCGRDAWVSQSFKG